MNDRRGTSLVVALAVLALVASLTAVSLAAATARVRLLSAIRWASEGDAVVDGALASIGVGQAGVLAALDDGGTANFGPVARGDGWSWSATALRRGALIRVVARATRRDASGGRVADRVASLLLVVTGADTVRVLAQRPRF